MLLLPLDPSETREANEDSMFMEIGAAMRKISADRDGEAPLRRGAHTKAHGILDATLEVTDAVDAELRHGLFAQPGRYEAVIRTSSYPENPGADTTPNVRGLGIKLLGAPGDRIVDDGTGALDLLLISSENVAFGTVEAFRDFMIATLTSTMGKWIAKDNRLELVAKSGSPSIDLLSLTFWSSTPFRLGPHVVKYRLQPVAGAKGRGFLAQVAAHAAGKRADSEYPFIRKEMQARLAEAPVAFELSVQRQQDPARQPVEDASVCWSATEYPWDVVARLEIPVQAFDTPERDARGEALRFDPWHVPVEMRPLGGLNRVRGAVYARMSQERLASASRPVVPYPVVERSPDDLRPVCLLDDDFDREYRAKGLEAAKQAFKEDPEKLPGFLMCAGSPDAANPRIGWTVVAGLLAIDIAKNVVANKRAMARKLKGEAPSAEDVAAEQSAQSALSRELKQAGKKGIPDGRLRAIIAARVDGVLGMGSTGALSLFNEDFPLYMYKTPVSIPRPSSVADLAAVHRVIPHSPAEANLDDDALFVRRRLVGPNAPFLRRVGEDAAAYAFADAAIAATTGDASVAAAAAEGRVFVCDYSVLATLPGGKKASDGTPMYIYAPTLVLAVPPGGGGLRAVAIRTSPGADAQVAVPGQGWGWAIAKHAVESADIVHFEPVTHLGHTHLVLEVAGLATFRHLPLYHPVARLLMAHVEGTISVNNSAVLQLLSDGGSIDQTFAADMVTIRALAVKTAIGHDLRGDSLPLWLARQGLDDRAVLPDHPWRDDALRIHGAIGRWVTAYVEQTYKDDAAMLADPELREWATALARPGGKGGLTGFGRLDARADLAAVLTELVYIASAGHAAVNFPQWTDAGFAGRMPGAGWAPLPALATATEQDLVNLLPPVDKAELQAEFLYLLGSIYHGALGRYDQLEGGVFEDPVVVNELLPRFQAELAAIEEQIKADNADPAVRAAPYEHLLPSRIPQSINV